MASLQTTSGATFGCTRRWGRGPSVVLLHAGVADRRSWNAALNRLSSTDLDLLTYDRRGYGETTLPRDVASFTHLRDLIDILDVADMERVVLVGNSMGGAVALDAAIEHPERVSAVGLVASAVSGMTDEDTAFRWQPDPTTAALIEAADDPHQTPEQRIEHLTHLWLDGPTSTPGRVTGPARALFTSMNRTILGHNAPDHAGDSNLDTWRRLNHIIQPVFAAWGSLDVPADVPFYEETMRRIGRGHGFVIPDAAHLPGLEQPEQIAQFITTTAAAHRVAGVR